IDLTRKGFFPEGSRILYAHLGGAPAINGYSYYYKDDGGCRKSMSDEALPPIFP
ncbi:MAG: aminocyclopropane-1-carboxylate deaminase/D-cysteine desulfhydrase family protein, partial [Mesorhizobium sp.]